MNIKLNISTDFFKEEERCGYIVSSEMKRVWAIELDLLNELLNVCKKNNLKIFADSGTILGAIRHQGMIPWDDDIDMSMMRDDYEKLCRIAPNEFKYPYFFQTEETDQGSLRCHAQLRNSATTGILASELYKKYKFNQGIFIDIFPLDVKTTDEKKFSNQCKKLEKIKSKMLFYRNIKDANPFNFRYNLIKYLGVIILHFLSKTIFKNCFNYNSLNKTFTQISTMYNNEKSEYVCYMCLPPMKNKRIWKKSWYKKCIYMKFEMLNIPIPIGYKEYLNKVYGQWQKFVKGASMHKEVIFNTEHPYNEVIKSI